jgi:integrase
MPRPRLPARLDYRKGKDRWVIIDGGKEINTGCRFGDLARAEEQFGEYRALHVGIDTSERNPAQIAVADVITLYIKHHAVAPAIYHAEPLIRHFGQMTLAEVNGRTCRSYADVRGAQVSLSTVRRELGTFQAALNFWHKESPLSAVPVVTKPEESPPRIRHLTRHEAARLLWAARRLGMRHIARFILIGLYTGTRHATILGLRWTPSDDAGWIDCQRGILYRAGGREIQSRKAKATSRIPERLMIHVRAWAAADLAKGPQTAVIRWKGQPIVKERRAWERVCKAAGIEDVTPHTLKHTCATWALASGMSIWDLAGLMGTSTKTIEATYGHHDPAFQVASAKAFRRAG